MGRIRMKLMEALGGSDLSSLIKNEVSKKLKEDNWKIERERTDREWRRITEVGVKDINPLEQDRMFKIAFYLYDKNGLGHRIIERYKDFVVGDGMTFDADNPEVMEILISHWEDSENAWELKQYNKMGELGLYGEQFYPAFVNEFTGFVRLGYMDPELVDEVQTDPNNAEKKISYTLKEYQVLSGGTSIDPNEKKMKYSIIHIDEDPDSKTHGFLIGDSFYFSVNTVSNQKRGRSDLLTIADAIDSYEQFLFNRAERAELLNRVIFDLKCIGKSDKEIKEILRDFQPPRTLEVFGHNEKVELNIKSPELGSQDASDEAKLLFNHIMGGSGFPPHWFGFAEGIVRATAMAMDLPSKKQLKTRQKVFKWMVSLIFKFVIHQAILKKKLDAKFKDAKFKLHLPKIEEKETEAVARALVGVTSSLVIGVDEGWISEEEATKIYIYILSQLGLELSDKRTGIADEDEDLDEKLKKIMGKINRRKAQMRKPGIKMPEEEADEEEIL